MRSLNPYSLSFLFHAALLVSAGFMFWMRPSLPTTERIEFTVYENPSAAPAKILAPLEPKAAPMPKKPTEAPIEGRSVFGISKKALTDESAGDAAVEVKTGNTLAVAPDDKKLNENDPDRLPLPTDEYLVTKMPTVLQKFEVAYPEAARKKGITGPVVMDLLIDEKGSVRETRLIRGPDDTLNQAAMETLRKFRFTPAYVQEKPVAVRIRYTYLFVLE